MPRLTKNKTTDVDNDIPLTHEKRGSFFSVFVLIVLFVIAAGGFVWSFTKYQKTKQQVAFLSTEEGQLKMAQQEVDQLLEKVSKLILLPEGEPVVATIQDAAALATQQAFYKDAQNDDKLLIYKDKAIIYSPARNIIVNVGPVFIQEGDQLRSAAEVLAEQNNRVKVEVRNGTPAAGMARTAADSLDPKVYNVITVNDAANKAYAQTVIVNLKGADVSGLVSQFGAQTVASLPAGEADSIADVIIILGQPNAGE